MGDNTRARTPAPVFADSAVREEAGTESCAKIGRRYDSVLPVPVGDIAARSRAYIRLDISCRSHHEQERTRLKKNGNPLGLDARWCGITVFGKIL